MDTILFQMEMIQRVAANSASIAAYEATKKPKRLHTPRSVTVVPNGENQWSFSSKLENQKALYNAAMSAEPGAADVQIRQAGILIYRVTRVEHEALRNPETQRAAALQIRAKLERQ